MIAARLAGQSLGTLKKSFFRPDVVLRSVSTATYRALSRIGSYVRTRAIGSIRSRKSASRPGKPPFSKTGVLKRFIYFSYDRHRQSVIVGPARTNQVFVSKDGQPVTGTVPEVLEYGGDIRVIEVLRKQYLRRARTRSQVRYEKTEEYEWRRADLRSKRRLAGLPMRVRKVTIEARPYMRPALAHELPKLPAMLRDSVRR